MPDFRAYAPQATADAREIRLDADESHHLVAVNRCSRGDPLVAFDGRGREWQCECTDAAKSGAVLTVKSTRQAPALPCAITLAQALPKGSTMDEIVRQATELGAARIVPLLTGRTQVHLDGDRADRKVQKWRTTAIEAAKQCGNPWVPEIAPVQKLDWLLTTAAKDYDLKLIASLHAGARPLRGVVAHWRTQHNRAPQRVLWLVGPEGDFSPPEMTACVMAGGVPVTLGPLVLRCDTAAVAALSVLNYELSS
ncbi:MAG: 16S rRNA (uracil(1498)-N(3))-methyltransferase [Opitutus sp.]|nr:16S rRNA (uracil(1498)-N(3))-methyltransferase [Opitutus sp.]